MRQVLERSFRLAKPNFEPGDGEPRERKVRIECERPVDEDTAGVKVVRHVRQRKSAARKRDGVVLAQAHRLSR